MSRTWLALIVSCAGARAFQPAVTASDAARRADTYAIYSQLLANPQTSHGADDNEMYLIGGTTVPGTPAEPCVQAPPDRAQRWAEVLADYRTRKSRQVTIQPELRIGKPYRILPTADIAEFDAARKVVTAHVSDFFRLTDVYFDKSRTMALVQISTWCGDLCAQWQWKVLEKAGGDTWRERQWVTCATMAEFRPAEPAAAQYRRIVRILESQITIQVTGYEPGSGSRSEPPATLSEVSARPLSRG